MTWRITPTQARTVGRVLRAEIARLKQSEAPAGVTTEAPMLANSGANQKAMSHA